MMIASVKRGMLRTPNVEVHRTEPRIVLQMEGSAGGNPKLKPTVFLPSRLLHDQERRSFPYR